MGRAFEYRKAAKMKRWDKMSKIFPKLGKAITVAAKDGGSDPAMNPKLRTAIQNAKAQNMPKDNIDNAIKRAAGKDAASFIEMNIEGKGPHGVLVFVECMTDNTTRTTANVKSYLNKAGGSQSPNGSLEFMFNRKTVIEFEKPEGLDLEELEFELIDAGLDEIEENDGTVYIYGNYTKFGELTQAFEEKEMEVKATLQRIPTSTVEFTEEQLEDIEKMLDKMEEDDDVQAAFNNLA